MEAPTTTPVPALWWLPYQLYKWLVIAPALILSTLVLGSVIILMCLVGLGRFTNVMAQVWARFNAYVTLMWVTVEGKELLTPGQSYVLAANHLSLVDIYLLYGFTGLDVRWVMKKELRKVPVLGLACELMGHIYIDRSRADRAFASLAKAKQRVTQGVCVVFFPEGTRSRSNEVGSFKRGAFHTAKELGVPVVPVSLQGTDKILPSDTTDWRPGKASVRLHEPIPSDDLSWGELAEASRKVITEALNIT